MTARKSATSAAVSRRSFTRLILDIELPTGGEVTQRVPPEFQGFAYVLEGEAVFGANRRWAKPTQLVLLGRDDELTITDASPAPGTC